MSSWGLQVQCKLEKEVTASGWDSQSPQRTHGASDAHGIFTDDTTWDNRAMYVQILEFKPVYIHILGKIITAQEKNYGTCLQETTWYLESLGN